MEIYSCFCDFPLITLSGKYHVMFCFAGCVTHT